MLTGLSEEMRLALVLPGYSRDMYAILERIQYLCGSPDPGTGSDRVTKLPDWYEYDLSDRQMFLETMNDINDLFGDILRDAEIDG
jgi:hypothetical protein